MADYKPKGKLGAGSRFKAIKEKMMKKEGYSAKQADAATAAIGRKKYGKKRFQELAAKARKKA